MAATFPDATETGGGPANTGSLADLRMQCDTLRRQGRAQVALDLLDSLPEEDRPSALALMRAQALNDLGRYEEALNESQCALEADPECADARFAQGFALSMLQRWPQAQHALDMLIAADPVYPHAAWLRAGLMRQVHGDLDDRVLAAFDLATEIDPANLYLRVERAGVLRACGRYEEARALYTEVCAAQNDDEPLWLESTFNLGCVALVLQDTAAARNAFRAVLDVSPDYPDAWAMYALAQEQG